MNALARLLALVALILCSAALVLRLVWPPGEAATGPSLDGPSAEDLPPVNPLDFADLADLALRGPRFQADTSDAFAETEGGGQTAAVSSALSLHAPQYFRAEVQEGGLRLSWQPHPENPVGSKVYRLTRWTGEGAAELVTETRGLEHFDPVACEGVSYHYRLQAMVSREVLSGQEVVRKSPSAATSAQLPRTMNWSSPGLAGEERIFLTAERRGRAAKGPFPTAAGEEIGTTGWFLAELRLRETEVQVETRSPRFDALGRRVIIDGRPADRVREVSANRILATVRLSDPCGSFRSLELLLPEVPAAEGE